MSITMQSLPDGYRAVVIGATGAIGAAFARHLRTDPRCAEVVALSRRSNPRLDFEDESTLAPAAEHAAGPAPVHLLLIATGVLHGAVGMPEKRLAQLTATQMAAYFGVNVLGPALVLKHFAPRLSRSDRCLVGILSAKVGSIADNRLGGWYSYRASKAALNMIAKTAAVELSRTHRHSVIACLHPGTVDSPLSAPFDAPHGRRAPDVAAQDMLRVLDQMSAQDSGSFWSYDGERLPW